MSSPTDAKPIKIHVLADSHSEYNIITMTIEDIIFELTISYNYDDLQSVKVSGERITGMQDDVNRIQDRRMFYTIQNGIEIRFFTHRHGNKIYIQHNTKPGEIQKDMFASIVYPGYTKYGFIGLDRRRNIFLSEHFDIEQDYEFIDRYAMSVKSARN